MKNVTTLSVLMYSHLLGNLHLETHFSHQKTKQNETKQINQTVYSGTLWFKKVQM